MGTIRFVLLESPLSLSVLMALVNFVLLVHWRRNGKGRPLLVGLTVWAGLMLVQALIVTPRERAAAILDRVELDLVARRADALETSLSNGFQADGMNKREFMALVHDELARVRVVWVRRMGLDIVSEGDGVFAAEASYLADVDSSQFRGTLRSRWRLEFRRSSGRWEIVEIQPISIDGVDGAGWDFRR